MVRTGLENLLCSPPESIAGRRLGVLCNQASVNRNFCHCRMLIHDRFPGQLTAIYAPQHGFFGEKQDNMIESDHMTDPLLGVPIFSLYGKQRAPNSQMLAPIDILLVDLQDVGTRVYTFVYTLSYCMEAAKTHGIKIIVLDRPNPINGIQAEGNCLAADCASFVGRYPLPMRHGLTIGELARLFNEKFAIGCDLEVIPMTGWKRSMYFPDTGLPWLAPSPNLPTPAAAMVYPGQVLWEGTNVSEGRGTTQPFEMFGAPWLDTGRIRSECCQSNPPGAVLRPIVFEPTANKWANRPCHGFQIHVTNPAAFQPYVTALALIQAVLQVHADRFAWKPPPYEYEYDRLPFDLITGDKTVRQALEQGAAIADTAAAWQDDLNRFNRSRRYFQLYD